MYHPSNEAYLQSRAIKTGQYRLATADQELVNRLTDFTGLNVLNFYFETVETTQGYRQQHIYVVLERVADCTAMDAANPAATIAKFQDYFNRNGPSETDSLKRKIFPKANGVYPETILAYRPLEEVELIVAYERASADIAAIANRYPEIWTISTNGIWRHVFYDTDAQLAANRTNGTNRAIEQEVLLALKPYDAFGYFGPHSLRVHFDSKESFDRDFEGKWHYYYR